MSGVTATGYVIKTPAEILSDIETKMEAVFGSGVIQTAQSPLGQLNGMITDLIAEMEERNQAVYQSYDPTQAEGVNLDKIGSIRGLLRGALTDPAYAKVITNENQTRVSMSDRMQAVMAISGVSWASVKENSTNYTDASGMPPHSLAFAVIGGADDDVAEAIYNNTIPGIGLFGMTSIPVSVGGYCRQVNFIRPVDIPVYVSMTVKIVDSACTCGLTSPGEVIAYLDAASNGDCGLMNGDLVDEAKIEALLGPIGGISVQTALIGIDPEDMSAEGYQATIHERPVIVAKNIAVRFV